jgi:hypothetical protein
MFEDINCVLLEKSECDNEFSVNMCMWIDAGCKRRCSSYIEEERPVFKINEKDGEWMMIGVTTFILILFYF